MVQKSGYLPAPKTSCLCKNLLYADQQTFSSSRSWQRQTWKWEQRKYRTHVMKFTLWMAVQFTQGENLSVANPCFWKKSYFHLVYWKLRQPLLRRKKKFMHRNVYGRSRWDRPTPELGWSHQKRPRARAGTVAAARTESTSPVPGFTPGF